MNDTLILVLSTIWSFFGMYLILWKLKMMKFEDQMQRSLDRALEDYISRIKTKSDREIERTVEEMLKDTLIEAKVVDKRVEFRFVKNEEEKHKTGSLGKRA